MTRRTGMAVLLTATAVLSLTLLVIRLGGADVGAAMHALWDGSLGSPYALFSATLVRATPLLFLGLGVAIAFRAGVLNIGAEGQLLLGATAAVAVALAMPTAPRVLVLPAALLAGALAGGAWSGVAAWLKARFGVLEVISTLMLNFVAINVISYMVRGPLQEPTRVYPQSVEISAAARLPAIAAGYRVHWGFVLGVVMALVLWWHATRTASGFRIRAVGAGPLAARRAGGIDDRRVITWVFLVSGALAGLGGASEATGVTYALYEGISPGYGYSAIAVALLARLHPLAVIGSAMFFGALEAGAAAMQRNANVPSVLAQVVEATLILGLLAIDHARRPEAS